jgi:hypothetical protein
MKRWLIGLSILSLAAIPAVARKGERGLVVHEWGTFLAMAGSDGVTLDGMYHEEHALPSFVHARSKEQLKMRSISLKGETPVIYFYTNQRQNVNVRVKFPKGIWTQWYPQASMVAPGLVATQPGKAEGGHICWNVEVIPPGDESLAASLPPVSTDALWKFSRQVDAAFVRRGDDRKNAKAEAERFIFYRGLGRASMPLEVSSADGGTLKLGALPGSRLEHLFVIRVEEGKASYRYIPALSVGEAKTGVIPSLQGASDISTFSRKVGTVVADCLEASGLYRKEAEAMVNTWRKSYFESDGIRVLFVLPQQWTDSFIPMSVHPKPSSLVRVMVGRTELLTPDREARAEAAILNLTSNDAAAREKAFSFLRSQGRYVEPVVNRMLRTSRDQRVRSACGRLLMTDFVTELRSAVHSAADGSKLEEKPAEVRANLAALLREMGYAEQAAEEGRSALRELSRISAPMPDHSDSRWYLRAFARANEGVGDDRGAADYYERFVRFGSLTKSCGGCHDAAGPQNMAFYREWWAGKKYAAFVQKLGLREATMKEKHEAVTRNPGDTASRMMLAYLTAEKGDRSAAEQLWASIIGRSRAVATAALDRRSRRSTPAGGGASARTDVIASRRDDPSSTMQPGKKR